MMTRDIILVSSGYDMHIRFWSDFNDSKCKHSIEFKEGAINALEITPNKEYVAFSSQNSIKFIDLVSLNSTPVYSIDSHEGIVSSILFPTEFENCFISAGEDCSAKINDIRTGKAVKEFYHSNYVNSVAIANNNKDLIAADENGSIKIWDINKGEVRTEFNSNMDEEGFAFRSVAVSDAEQFLVGARSSGTCCVFDYGHDRDIKYLSSFEAHKNYITKCVLSPEYK
jgi:WD40 repeat protein